MTERTFTERRGPRLKSGAWRTKTHRWVWAVCDVCGQGIWTSRLAKKKNDPVPGLTCRMTPKCGGKHRKVESDG